MDANGMTRNDRISAYATKIALRPVKARKGKGRGRMSAATRDRLAGLALLIERAAPQVSNPGLRGQQIVHIPVELILEIRKELKAR